MEHQQLSIEKAFSFAWAKFKEKALFFIGLTLLTVLVNGIGENVFTVYTFIGMILSAYLSLGIWRISIMHIRGEEVQISDLLTISLSQFFHYTIAGILNVIVVGIGLIFLIVPGIYIASRLLLMPAFIIDKDQSFDQALQSSWNATKENSSKIFLWLLLSFFLAIIGVLALIVGLLVAIPVITLSMAYIYVKLTDEITPEGI